MYYIRHPRSLLSCNIANVVDGKCCKCVANVWELTTYTTIQSHVYSGESYILETRSGPIFTLQQLGSPHLFSPRASWPTFPTSFPTNSTGLMLASLPDSETPLTCPNSSLTNKSILYICACDGETFATTETTRYDVFAFTIILSEVRRSEFIKKQRLTSFPQKTI